MTLAGDAGERPNVDDREHQDADDGARQQDGDPDRNRLAVPDVFEPLGNGTRAAHGSTTARVRAVGSSGSTTVSRTDALPFAAR